MRPGTIVLPRLQRATPPGGLRGGLCAGLWNFWGPYWHLPGMRILDASERQRCSFENISGASERNDKTGCRTHRREFMNPFELLLQRKDR